VDLPKGSACPTWIVPNAGATGYYRTAWTAAQLAELPLTQLSPAERLMLAYDLAALPSRDAARASLSKLATDSEPEVAKAVQEALPATGRGR
jgi:alanyl aminopeptidase